MYIHRLHMRDSQNKSKTFANEFRENRIRLRERQCPSAGRLHNNNASFRQDIVAHLVINCF